MADVAISGLLGADNAVVQVDCGSCSAFSGTLTGALSGTVTFQVLYDATEGWVSAPCFTRPKAAATATLTAAGNRLIDTTDALAVRATIHPYVSGAPEVTLAGMVGVNLAAGGGGGGGAVTVTNPADFVDGWDATQGLTTSAGIITDINGTAQGFRRGNIKMWLNFLARLPAALVGGRLDVNVGAGTVTGNQGTPNAGGVNAWPVTLASTLNEANDSVTGHIGGYSKVASLTITRPANTTPYTAGDEIADVAGTAAQRTFACARVNNGTGVITGAALIYSNNPAVTPTLELYLFDTDPTSAGDNAAFAPTDAQLATAIGVITFPSPKVGTTGTSGNLLYDSGPLSIEFAATGGTTSLFGLLVTRVGFTPIAVSEPLTVRLRCEQN